MTNIKYNCDICGKEIGTFHQEIRFDGGFFDLLGSKIELCSHCYKKVTQVITKTVKELKRSNENRN